ncbi:unnamed protein product [marine sediment metagenome]|uniref:Uncharacterized protein n=1 Tax=marine sediment metagenome TaxID=412755 RepID=X1VER1_9ZZZZ
MRYYVLKRVTSTYDIPKSLKELLLLTRSYRLKVVTFTYERLRTQKSYFYL